MKPFLMCLIAFALSVPATAQNLSLRQLLKFRSMEVATLDRKLTQKGWHAMSDIKPTAGIMGRAVWAFSPSPTGEGATA